MILRATLMAKKAMLQKELTTRIRQEEEEKEKGMFRSSESIIEDIKAIEHTLNTQSKLNDTFIKPDEKKFKKEVE